MSGEPCPAAEPDIVVVGGGLAGSLAAALLGRDGRSVEVIDLHASVPADFRVEKISGPQAAAMRRLGFLDLVAKRSTLVERVTNVDRAGIVDVSENPHYSLSYRQLVELVRDAIPSTVTFTIERVSAIETGPDRQLVQLSSGRRIRPRLVVLASGLADKLRDELAIKRRVLVAGPTLAFGFDVVPAPGTRFRHAGLSYYGSGLADGIDYLALLRSGEILRGNLFTFCDHREPWVAELRRDPGPTLARVLPGLVGLLGAFQVRGKVQVFVMRVTGVEDPVRDGLVLVGDAFQTSCPAAGTGVGRLLHDVDVLCRTYVPRWLATPGMSTGKIAAFYADEAKLRLDAAMIRAAVFRRGITLQPNLAWKLRRRASFLRRRVIAGLPRGAARVRDVAALPHWGTEDAAIAAVQVRD